MIGLDISSYQKGINFNEFKSNNVDFLILRAGFTGWGGDGTNKNKDNCFEDFYKKAKSIGIPVGAYWYSCANTYEKGQAEAQYMYENCLKGKQFEFPIYIDVEENRHQQVGKTYVTSAINGFCETLEKLGFYVGIYANLNYFNNYINTPALSRYDKWLAYWKNDLNKPAFPYGDYGLWQNSSNGKVAGFRVDTDFAYKNYPEIIKNAKLNGFNQQQNLPDEKDLKYVIGNVYTLQVDLNVRYGAGTEYERKKYSELTPDGKKHAFNQYYAVLKKGTRVTCLDIIIKSNNEIWLKIPSGYVAGIYNGKEYIK